VSVVCSRAQRIRQENGPGLGQGRLRFTPRLQKLPGAGRSFWNSYYPQPERGPVEGSELRRISCFPSHSGHRAVVHRSRSETCRTRLTPRPFVPKPYGRNRRANWPRPKVAGASFLQQGYGNDSTHYPHPCRRHHNRTVTGLWLASLHDGKRGTSQISQSASLYAWQRTLLE
jgi:hypothetical protein